MTAAMCASTQTLALTFCLLLCFGPFLRYYKRRLKSSGEKWGEKEKGIKKD